MIKTVIQHAKKHPGVGWLVFMYSLSLEITFINVMIYMRPKDLTVTIVQWMLGLYKNTFDVFRCNKQCKTTAEMSVKCLPKQIVC